MVREQETCSCSTCHGLVQKMSEMEQLTDRLETENKNLRKNEELMKKRIKKLTDDDEHLENLIKKYQREIEHLKKDMCHLQYQLNKTQEEVKDRDEVKQELDHVKCLLKKQQAELSNLISKLHYYQKQEEFLNKQKLIVHDLAQLESQIDKENSQPLKTTVQDLQCQLEEAQELLLIKDELIIEQNKEMDCNQQVIMDSHALTGHLKKSLEDLMVQLMILQMGDIQADKDNIRAESWPYESPPVEVVQESPPSEALMQVSPAVGVLLQESPHSEVLLQEPSAVEVLLLEASALQETPAVEPSKQYHGKRLLQVGLCTAGISAVGILIPAAMLTTGLTCNCDIAYELGQLFCNLL
ncbi:putative trichohyalin-like [Scophthalmus maximus]|uniref:Putative trichohyalin-like n=1 Tax=Scophthalmus maximus TaxID=52904 RepID=A0A2U9BJL9_SCOMX|nr:putative trichohyalin-like [Scophthalmus maximus]